MVRLFGTMNRFGNGSSGAEVQRTDADLVLAARRGDKRASVEIVARHQAMVCGVALSILGDFSASEDAGQEAFLTAWRKIHELREPERLMGYVRTVVRRQAAGYIQGAVNTRRRYIGVESCAPLRAREVDPENRAIEAQNNGIAMRVLQSLPHRDREVLVRFYLREETPEQICAALEITQTQFRLIKSRAKTRYGELGRRRFSLRTGSRS